MSGGDEDGGARRGASSFPREPCTVVVCADDSASEAVLGAGYATRVTGSCGAGLLGARS